jgi:hypothetical protein
LEDSKKRCIFAADNLKVKKFMKQEYSIELLEEYDKVNFYSIRMKDAELTELEAFFEKFPEGCEYDNEIDVMLAPYVKLLIDTSRFISSRIKNGTTVLVDKEIVGNLNFTRYEKS